MSSTTRRRDDPIHMEPSALRPCQTRPLKLLVSAYACEPGTGSEPGVGWNLARELAKHHLVWVVTRANNRAAIEAELMQRPVPGLRFAYTDLPPWSRWWKRGERGVQLYYYLWQILASRLGRRLHREIGFDLAHHVTFGKYWAPSFLSLLTIPYVWGPVGGGESIPETFLSELSPSARRYERIRAVVRAVSEHDPLVRRTARHSRVALAKTHETALRLEAMGARKILVVSEAALGREERDQLASRSVGPDPQPRFVSIARLLGWKGVHLGLRAFAAVDLPTAEYWIIGAGPERAQLSAQAQALGIADRVHFLGKLPRDETLERLKQCTALIHPSLHDSGGWVCLEAMAAGTPVICLDLGGPAVQVTSATGFKIAARTPQQAVEHLARAMTTLASDGDSRRVMGDAGQSRVRDEFGWDDKVRLLNDVYADALGSHGG